MKNNQLLTLQNLVKIREKGDTFFTLKVDKFHVYKGEFVGIFGPSGCGKSTFLDILGLILSVNEAENFSLNVNGKMPIKIMELNDAKLAIIRRRHIGYILQSGGLLPFLSVKNNILLSGRLNNLTIPEETFFTLVEQLGIRDQINKKPQHLSGGQRQRVAIARALIHKPALILADEPTASVDRPTALEIRDQFKTLAKENNLTVLMVSHDTEMLKDNCDRIFTFIVKKAAQNKTVARVIEQ